MLKITDKVIEFNKLNKNFDYLYMYSDDGSSYRKGQKQASEIFKAKSQLNQDEKDLVALYNNHILHRNHDVQTTFLISKNTPDSLQEALKYYKPI